MELLWHVCSIVTFADVSIIFDYATIDGKRAPFFPLSHGVPRVDDRRVIRGIDSVIRDGLRWKDAPNASGPHKHLSNRFVRWPRLGVCQRSVAVLANQGPKPSRLMSDATHLKAHRPAAS